MSNLETFNAALKELRKGNEKAAHEIAECIKVVCKYDELIEDMRKKV